MNRPEIKEIIWDADNTMWNWIRFAAVAYPKMAETIAKQTGIPLQAVIAGMKEYYTIVGTMESPWLIQGLNQIGFFKKHLGKNPSPEFLDQLRLDAKSTFQYYRSQNFNKFKGIKEVLEITKSNNIKNRVLTDAPRIQAIMRLKVSKLDKNISHLHTLKTYEIITELPPEVREAQKRGKYDIGCPVDELDIEKPDTRLEDILEIVGSTHDQIKYIQNHVMIIGDSYPKDMGLVKRYGCTGIHAAWGKPTQEQIDIVRQFAPDKIMQKNMAIQADSADNSNGRIVTIDNIHDIKDGILEELQIAA